MDNLTAQKLMDQYGFTIELLNVCEILSLTKDTVLRMLARNEIPAKKLGKKWLISTEKFAEYLTSSDVKKESTQPVRGKRIIV